MRIMICFSVAIPRAATLLSNITSTRVSMLRCDRVRVKSSVKMAGFLLDHDVDRYTTSDGDVFCYSIRTGMLNGVSCAHTTFRCWQCRREDCSGRLCGIGEKAMHALQYKGLQTGSSGCGSPSDECNSPHLGRRLQLVTSSFTKRINPSHSSEFSSSEGRIDEMDYPRRGLTLASISLVRVLCILYRTRTAQQVTGSFSCAFTSSS